NEELFEHIWHTCHVTDWALTQRIKEIRHKIGDNGRQQRVIKTLKEKGHRFVASVICRGPGLESLREMATLTSCIWPLPASSRDIGQGILPSEIQRIYPLGSHISLALDLRCTGYLLLLNEGTSGKNYCLCPSWFARNTRLQPDLSYLPQED